MRDKQTILSPFIELTNLSQNKNNCLHCLDTKKSNKLYTFDPAKVNEKTKPLIITVNHQENTTKIVTRKWITGFQSKYKKEQNLTVRL